MFIIPFMNGAILNGALTPPNIKMVYSKYKQIEKPGFNDALLDFYNRYERVIYISFGSSLKISN